MKIIGLTGVKESGKSTAFEIIKKNYKNVEEIQLAKKLKDVCSEVFNVNRTHFDDQRYKEKDLCSSLLGIRLPFLKRPVTLKHKHIKKILELYDITEIESLTKPHLGKVLVSPRQIAQYIGTEVLRQYDEDIHCNAAIRDAMKTSDYQNKFFVVTDMRFPNEIKFFSNHENFIAGLAIYRTEKINKLREDIINKRAHASEKLVLEVIPMCEVVKNDGTIEELERNLSRTLSILKVA